jgi:signal transduction histidine kinase
MKRLWRIWLIFGLAVAVLLAGMGWVSLTALRLEREAAIEESVRLALWRMDSNLSLVIAQENARPYFAYTAIYPAERAYTRMFAELQRGDVLVPSPLLTETSPYILLHFQLGPDGALTSPQVPTGNMRDLAESHRYTTSERIEAAVGLIASLRKTLKKDIVLRAFPKDAAQPTLPAPAQAWQQEEGQQANQPQAQQTVRNISEYQARVRSYQKSANPQQAEDNTGIAQAPKPPNVSEGVLRPVWVGELLVLARRVRVNGGSYVQGCWLNWPAIEKWLLGDIRDLLPSAKLEPQRSAAADPRMQVLASLPVRLVPGSLPPGPQPQLSPIQLALLVAWGCVVAAATAVAVLLIGAVSLSERRATFVSAVTHELRTPLTTFQLYSEMLSEGMIADEEKRRSYLKTLCIEADRLSHLVENVLAYARLERGRTRGQAASIALGDLLERARDRLARRAEQAGMTLVVGAPAEALALRVRADASAVEQILLNLVDNACKYASSASDKRIELEAGRSDGFGILRVRDHGPGISAEGRSRLFRPFSKSAREAAHSKPGVGLGLALSRRLARDMGGDLRLDEAAPDGACFVLSLPLA